MQHHCVALTDQRNPSPAPPCAAPPTALAPPVPPHPQVSFTRVVQAVESAAAYLPGKMAQLAGVQDPETAAAKLREEPCFCMEAAVKLFYWMRLACE